MARLIEPNKGQTMRDRDLNFPSMTEAELDAELQKRLDLLIAGENATDSVLRYNKLHADKGELNRRRLVSTYGITLDDFGNYATITHAHKLLIDATKAVCNTLTETAAHLDTYGGTGDDGSDYLNAAADQLSFLAEQNAEFDDKSDETAILRIINMTEDAAIDDTNAMAFRYGYADHGSPISDLMFANYDESTF